MKKQSNLSRLLEIAGSHKYLTYASWVLSAISALIALVPFYYENDQGSIGGGTEFWTGTEPDR